jgi:hypothetical protein
MHTVRGGHVFGRVRLHCLQELHPGLFLARQRVPVQRLLSRNVWDGLRSGFMLELFRRVLLYRRDDGLPAVRGWHVRKGERHGGVPGMPRWDVRDERGDAGTRFSKAPLNSCFSWQCFYCLPGTYGIGRLGDEWDCTACGVGRYSTMYGASKPADCLACGAGLYSPLFRAVSVSHDHRLCFSATHSTPS